MRTKPFLAVVVLLFGALPAAGLAPKPAPAGGSSAATEPAHVSQAQRSPLAFLAGRWVGSLGPNTIDEQWMPPVNGNVTSCFRMFDADGNLAMVELITITTDKAGETTLRMRHFDAALTPWASEAEGPYTARLTTSEANKLTFEAPGQALRGIVYDGTSAGEMIVTLHFAEETRRPPLRVAYTKAE